MNEEQDTKNKSYDQMVLEKLVQSIKDQPLITVIFSISIDNFIDIDHKMNQYLQSIDMPVLLEREKQSLKNIYGDRVSQYRFIQQIEKVIKDWKGY